VDNDRFGIIAIPICIPHGDFNVWFQKKVSVDQFGFGVLQFASSFVSTDCGRSLGMRFENYDASQGWSNFLQSVGVPIPALKLYHRLYTHSVLQTAFTQFDSAQRRMMTQGAMDGIQDRPADYDFLKTVNALETAYKGHYSFSPTVQSLANPEARLTFLPNPNAGPQSVGLSIVGRNSNRRFALLLPRSKVHRGWRQ